MKQIRRLDELLAFWEYLAELGWWSELYARWDERSQIVSVDGSHAYWKGFRRELFESEPTRFDRDLWIRTNPTRAFPSYRSVPLELFAWHHHSRRVFGLSEETEQKLMALPWAEYVRWEDIPWPFPSFLVQFESGRPHAFHDAILVSRVSDWTHSRRSIIIRLIPKNLPALMIRSRLEAIREAGRQESSDAPTKLRNLLLEEQRRLAPFIHPERPTQSSVFEVTSKHVNVNAHEAAGGHVKRACRIVAHLCQYIRDMPTSETSAHGLIMPERANGPNEPTLASDPEHLFWIGHEHTLGPEKKARGKESGNVTGREVSPHDRSPYWRRPPNTTPNHPQTVEVRKTRVREDLERTPPTTNVDVAVVSKTILHKRKGVRAATKARVK